MTEADFDAIRSMTDGSRVWVGDEIAKEYYRDEMPEYGIYPPELYVEAVNKGHLSVGDKVNIPKLKLKRKH